MSERNKLIIKNIEILICVGLLIFSLAMIVPDWNQQPKCKDIQWFIFAELSCVELYNLIKENKNKIKWKIGHQQKNF